MPEIRKIELEREDDTGVHEVKDRTRLEPVEPAPPGSENSATEKQRLDDERRKQQDKQEFERATTPFPGG